MTAGEGRRAHWERVATERGPEGVSWFEPEPRTSLEMIDALGVGPGAAVIDVGGGASRLAAALAARGFTDVTVLDLSEGALRTAREEAGAVPGVGWIRADVLEWTPARAYDLWHDRAVFHFMAEPEARSRYVAAALAAVRPGGHLVVATFAEDGPPRCSGLPVARYDARSLAAAFGDSFGLVEDRREQHRTPRGAIQPFTWVALRRDPEAGGASL